MFANQLTEEEIEKARPTLRAIYVFAVMAIHVDCPRWESLREEADTVVDRVKETLLTLGRHKERRET